MAALQEPWAQFGDEQIWHAVYKGGYDEALNLTVFLGRDDGLWRAVVEYRNSLGSWPSPSPFSTQEIARQWAEARAEQIGGPL